MKLISPENKAILIKRGKSFLWRLGGYALVACLNYVVTNLELINLAPEVVVVIALVIGEVTKYINKNLPELRKVEN